MTLEQKRFVFKQDPKDIHHKRKKCLKIKDRLYYNYELLFIKINQENEKAKYRGKLSSHISLTKYYPYIEYTKNSYEAV